MYKWVQAPWRFPLFNHRPWNSRAAAALILLTLAFWPQRAEATVANFLSFKQAYPSAKGVSCKTCHQGAIGKKGDLNAYGTALQKLKLPKDAKSLKADDFHAMDDKDSDGDGIPNGKEIEAGTNPGEGKPASSKLQTYLDQWITPSALAAPTSEKAEYVGSETCATCHAKQMQEFKRSTHARIAIRDEKVQGQGCEMCHGPGSLHVAAGGGRGIGGIINPRKDPSPCFACHLDKKAEFRLPFHHPVLEGKMSCADCHSAHGEEVRPWSATTLADVNEACFKCHKEQRGPFAWEHEALREGCTTCHKVHGSIHEKMLVARDNNLCLRCHTQVNFPTIGKQNHGGRLPQGTCFSAGCHTAVHGSNFDDHLRY